MSELSDDIARGCLENGEPIEARWGTGEWSAQPEQQQEPDPWEEALAAAEQRGYVKGEEHGYACGWKQAMVAVENNGCSKLGMITIPISLLRLLSDKYLKEEGNPNGN